MTTRFSLPVLACALVAGFVITAARVSIAGTSNIHEFTASTTDVKLARLVLADNLGGATLNAIVNPGSLQALDIVVKAGTLTSPKEGLDKNMWKALKTDKHPDI